MHGLRHITPNFAIAPQLVAGDFEKLRGLGFAGVIDNRPDDEEGVALPSSLAADHARKAELAFHYVPAVGHDLFGKDLVDQMDDALRAATGPVLAYCKSGTRSAILWALAEARHRPMSQILADLARADYELEMLRSELEAEAARFSASAPAAA